MTLEQPHPSLVNANILDGRSHLEVLARAPRAPGTTEEHAAREHCARVLRGLGYDVAVEPFEYSALPGRYGMPIGGAIGAGTVLVTVWLASIQHAPRGAAAAFGVGLLVLALFAQRMLGDGVLDLSWMRARADNLVARRGRDAPCVWLVAHVDSKSQPIPSRVRVAGVVLLALAILLTLGALGLTLGIGSSRTLLWLACAASGAMGGAVIIASVVGNDSFGAVDNASGVAAVLSAAAMLDPASAVGILIPSAEELGLAGARAWVRANRSERALVLNCDGVDDQGELTLMYTRRKPDRIVDAVRNASGGDVRVLRMPPGLLLDSVAFADAGWEAITVSHGSMRTLARVHTRRDSLDHLRGDSIDSVGGVLARAAEALTR
ncbi:MAG TPA: M28 family peptidase [Gemmatimonadaceae bacterium]|nr:M28 family peptidase [Gemmatimonadaceae bacterium]